ncbi:hypothetical protein LY76DRAFT_365037 [Colletotrichum caudatum]|nr:hypothetical protein LY76DRAFT_365037 [Colletotrichum caudatum]
MPVAGHSGGGGDKETDRLMRGGMFCLVMDGGAISESKFCEWPRSNAPWQHGRQVDEIRNRPRVLDFNENLTRAGRKWNGRGELCNNSGERLEERSVQTVCRTSSLQSLNRMPGRGGAVGRICRVKPYVDQPPFPPSSPPTNVKKRKNGNKNLVGCQGNA